MKYYNCLLFGVLVNFRKLLIGFRLREKRLDGLGMTGEHVSSLKLLWDCLSARGCHSMPAESAGLDATVQWPDRDCLYLQVHLGMP